MKKVNQHCLVYGVRMVGKTTLIHQATKEIKADFVSFECLKLSLKDNISLLTDTLIMHNIIPVGTNFSSFISLFQYLNSLNRHIVILIDEYPYLYEKTNNSEVDSIFQSIIDLYASNLNIILPGSNVGMMKTLLAASNPLYARFKCYLHLKEMDYLEASKFYPTKTPYEKGQFYSIFGGSPYILAQLEYEKTLEENIINSYLNCNSVIKMFTC